MHTTTCQKHSHTNPPFLSRSTEKSFFSKKGTKYHCFPHRESFNKNKVLIGLCVFLCTFISPEQTLSFLFLFFLLLLFFCSPVRGGLLSCDPLYRERIRHLFSHKKGFFYFWKWLISVSKSFLRGNTIFKQKKWRFSLRPWQKIRSYNSHLSPLLCILQGQAAANFFPLLHPSLFGKGNNKMLLLLLMWKRDSDNLAMFALV